jgi:anti-sigma factor RsiW
LDLAVSAVPRYRASGGLRGRLARSAAAAHPTAHQANARWLALAAGLLLGAVALWRFAPVADRESARMESQIVENHIRSLLADHLVDVHSDDSRAIQPWFNGKLDYAPQVEDISAHGFHLLGGRLDYLGGRAVAALVYQRAQHIINVFVWPAAGQPDRGPRARSVEGYQAVSWRAKGMNWWAVSDLNAADLEELPLCPCFMPPHPPLEARNIIRPASDRRGP